METMLDGWDAGAGNRLKSRSACPGKDMMGKDGRPPGIDTRGRDDCRRYRMQDAVPGYCHDQL